MNHTDPVAILSSQHGNHGGRCLCGAPMHTPADAFAHGQAVGYRLGRVEERDAAVKRAEKAYRHNGRDVEVADILIPSPASEAELDAYRNGPMSPSKRARKVKRA